MISNPEVAKSISDLMIETYRKLDDSIRVVQRDCTIDEFKKYRLAAAKVIAELYTEVMVPLYQEHPQLKPDGMKI